jgi:hypothetical protein
MDDGSLHKKRNTNTDERDYVQENTPATMPGHSNPAYSETCNNRLVAQLKDLGIELAATTCTTTQTSTTPNSTLTMTTTARISHHQFNSIKSGDDKLRMLGANDEYDNVECTVWKAQWPDYRRDEVPCVQGST